MIVTLREAGPGEDLAAIGALHHRSRVAAYRGFLPLDALESFGAGPFGAWWTERWKWERETHRLTLAERDGRPVGFAYVGPDGDEEGVAQLYAIHLEPDEQGKGVGRLLMLDALNALKAAGWPRVVLWVLAGNAHARRFYERGGWVPDGREREDAIGTIMTTQLRYVLELV
jgi:GNAT superfamily N-acetyltransferase